MDQVDVDALTAEDLKVLVCSSNIGNTQMSVENLTEWVPRNGTVGPIVYDVIAIGMQEAVFSVTEEEKPEPLVADEEQDEDEEVDATEKAAAEKATEKSTKSQGGWGALFTDKMNNKCSTYIIDALNEALGEGFTCVENVRAMQMRLFVFVNNKTQDTSKAAIKAMAIQKDTENTGLGRFLGNKGGQCIKLTLNGTSLCFVSCHLAAHEGGKHLEDRNSDCREIMSGVDVGQKGLDLGSQFHHCFWMGDMNYRVDLGTVEEYHHLAAGDGKDKKTLQAQKFEIVSELVTKLDGPDRASALATLHKADELSGAMARKDVLVGFEELPGLPTFHPTFKVHRWEAEKYVVKRTPSYCDRILVKSLPGFKSSVETIAYEACPTFVSSDHKPVRAGYSLKQPVRTIKVGTSNFTVTVSDIKVTVEGRTTTKRDVPDMYVKLLADPVDVIKKTKGGEMQTKHTQNITEHSFADVLTASVHAEQADLGNAHLMFLVMDKDTGTDDDELGSACVCFSELRPLVKYELDTSLVLNGLPGGTISCSVLLTPVSAEEEVAGDGCCTIM